MGNLNHILNRKMERLLLLQKNLLACPFQGKATTNPHATAAAARPPVKVVITGAAGAIGYVLCFMIGQGKMFGPDQRVDLVLLELPVAEGALKGTLMELEDCALPLLSSLKGTTDPNEGFADVDFAILVGAKPRGPGMERKDLLTENAKIFINQGKLINSLAKPTVKVLVVGNPANTNALIVSAFATRINPRNVTSLTRLDQNRAISQIAGKLRCPVDDVKNLIIWGNHSLTQFPDPFQGYVFNYPSPGLVTSVRSAVNDDAWLKENFIPRVQKRGAEIIQARKLSSAASAANAVCDHIFSWVNGTRPGAVSYTHLRAHETGRNLVCRLLLEKKKDIQGSS
eukprot:TRINITY_DN3057_c0_g1_i3.p1 TRINITY_DN3057_c0_g1~~TRINITY_DN3057_c0_g1_i3.p1  ORF type:complete len:341 (+),score=111.14 TRINITY_DN3057_c0_g1_i3:39-1061(+)